MKIYEVHPSLICAMSTSTNSMPYPLVPQCLCTADCHIHHPSSHHCHSTYFITHGAAPRSECGGSRATPPAPSNARAARLDGDDLGGRRVEGTLRLATTCYDLAICYISSTYPIHSTLHPQYACSICSLLSHFIRLQCEVCHISSRRLWLRPANS